MEVFAREMIELYPALMYIWAGVGVFGIFVAWITFDGEWPLGEGCCIGTLMGTLLCGLIITGLRAIAGLI